jgi:hypothetical protein
MLKMLYNLLKNLITNNYFTKEDMTNKLNVFMLYNQVTEPQYSELIALVNPTTTPVSAQ